MDSNNYKKILEARVGIEPTHKGFADLSLTTWVPRPDGFTLARFGAKIHRYDSLQNHPSAATLKCRRALRWPMPLRSRPMSQDFFAAIHDNDHARVGQLLAADPSLAKARNQNGVSAIMQARYEGRHELVALLRSKAGELDGFEAATLGDLPRLRALLGQDAALAKSFSRDGFTALHLATFFGQLEASEELLRRGADVNAVATNPMKVSVINSAAASGRADLVKLVLRAGADPNARQMMGYTALHAAAARDSVEMVQALLDAGADPTLVNDEGQSPADKAGPAVAALLASKK